jgi:hypothetical protein
MKEIDDIFNEMEKQVNTAGTGMSTMIINFGMVVVIIFSIFLWVKMNSYEGKHA